MYSNYSRYSFFFFLEKIGVINIATWVVGLVISAEHDHSIMVPQDTIKEKKDCFKFEKHNDVEMPHRLN